MITPVPPNHYDSAEDITPEISQGATAVASSKGRNLLMIGLIVGGCAIIAWLVFGGNSENKKAPPPLNPPVDMSEKIQTKPAPPPVEVIPTPAPSLPEPPPLKELTLPEPPTPAQAGPVMPTGDEPNAVLPPPPPSLDVSAEKTKSDDPELKQRMDARKKAGIIVKGGKGLNIGGMFGRDEQKANEKIERTGADQSTAKTIGDPSIIIAQGKIIDAVLETAINTDIPGPLRGIVNRDIYAETGKAVLIPKGSRLIGKYEANVVRGQSRVAISWDRLIRPNGTDIELKSPAVDPLGRSGIEGTVYDRYGEMLQNSLLVSILTFTTAIGAEKISGSDNGVSLTQNSGGGTTTSGSASDFALLQGVTSLGNLGKGLLSDFAQVKPTITIDQGTKIKVFVNRDLVFPEGSSTDVRLVK
ncbi:MAG: TrbI/VirB10 family protein [Alphaproteobacteria bacterium]|nr:TrbI/VirB10 family protein [Alphaproteobacteria bacterium]